MNVCFLPGSMCDERVFGHQILAATTAGWHCDVADLNSQTSIEAMAAQVIDSTTPGVVLVGISLGAIVAAEVVAQAPLHASAVALISTNLDAPDDRQLATRAEWGSHARSGEFTTMVAAGLAETITLFPHRHSELIFDMAMTTTAQGFLNQNEALLRRPDRRDSLADFAGPILIASGAEDHVCPPALHHELARRLPQATLELVAEAGHLSTIDQPDALSRVIVEWLEICTKQIITQEGTHEYEHA